MAKKPYTKKKNNNKKHNNDIQDEIIIISTLLISILLFLSNFNLSGKIGSFFNSIIFGLIGLQAYILPFMVFFLTIFKISNKNNKKAGQKIMAIMALLLNLAALIQLISSTYNADLKVIDYYINSSANKSGGGLIGGVQVMIYCMLFDELATYIILISIITVTIVIISGKAVFTYFTKKVSFKKNIINKEVQENKKLKVVETDFKRRPAKMFDLTNFNKQDNNSKDTNVIEDKKKSKKKAKHKHDMKEIITNDIQSNDYINHDNNKDDILIKNYYNEDKKAEKDIKAIDLKDKNDDSSIKHKMNLNKDNYIFPSINLLSKAKNKSKGMTDDALKETAYKLQSTLLSFGVNVNITNISCGPSVTRYEIQPEQGVKVSRITNLADDIKLNLAAADIRIEAPIPGKAAVGIEVPNSENSMVTLRDLIEDATFKNHDSDIAFAVGKDISGKNIVTDIGKMPHLLIAGATGSGKSVCINTIIMSLIYKSNPSDVRLIMIDPKIVELSVYNGIPHLLIPVVTDPKKASAALAWAVAEMVDRYDKFASLAVRDLKGYNDKIKSNEYKDNKEYEKLPQIVIIIDELADLMMVAPGEVEDSICRLAQMARAAGLHLIIATQRPSVNVITGLIKANVPSRIAFAVSSAIDSRTILDGSGAEKLLGKGDMLFFPSGYPKPIRIQGAFISDKEVSAVVNFLKQNNKAINYSEEINKQITDSQNSNIKANIDERDEYFIEAAKFLIKQEKASIGMLQRIYRIGFNRAARMMDQLYEANVVGPDEGTKPRQVLMTLEEFEKQLEDGNI